EIGPCQLDAGRKGKRSAVHAMETIAGCVGGQARRAADPRDKDDLMRGASMCCQGMLQRGQHAVVSAARAPDWRGSRVKVASVDGRRSVGDSCWAHISSPSRKMRGEFGRSERQRAWACQALGTLWNSFVRQEMVVELGAMILLHHNNAPGAFERAGERLHRQRREYA